jgi:ribonuclease D
LGGSSRSPLSVDVIETAEQLARMLDEVRSNGSMGIDTEFMREKTYRARLCLVQISTREGIYLIDPLEDHDLGAVAAIIADPEIETLVHAGRQDFEIFYERWGAVPANVFDVQLAAGYAGLGASLPYGRLVESVTGATISKGESYTDWCRRPLTKAQFSYAADDVRYLHVIADVLKDKLRISGRLQWAADEMSSFESADLYELDPAEVYRKVSGRGNLSGKQMSILRELARWREEIAIKRDIPRGWVIKDQTLIEIARRGPKDVGELRNLRGMVAKEAERSGPAILDAIAKGRVAPPIETPSGPSRSAQARARTLAGLADAIVRSRCEGAGLAAELVSTRGELEALLADVFDGGPDPSRHRMLQGWREELVGSAVVDLARGRIAVRSVDRPPYIEEVPLP